MSLRQYIYETLKNWTALQTLVADRVYQGESLTASQVTKPFLVYHMGNDTDLQFAERDALPHQQFVTIYAHDVPADYSQVDTMIAEMKKAFRASREGVEGIITIRYLETSRDLDDQVMGTIMRYARFLFIMGS